MLLVETKDLPGRWNWWCPGCQSLHIVITEKQPTPGPVWSWNGRLEKPTIRPSILTSGGSDNRQCHVFITDGQIEYLNDCKHSLAGKTVPMEPVPL